MTQHTDATPPRRKPDWVLAVLTGAAVASVIATVVVFQTYSPPGPDAAQVAAWRQRSLAACRADPDLLAHLGITAPAYDYLTLQTPQFRFTIHRDGRAGLHVDAPEAERGDFTLHMGPADFARLALLTTALQFEQRGSQRLPDPDEVDYSSLEAGRDGNHEFVADRTTVTGEFEALEACLRSLSSDQRWVRDTSADVIIVD
jgi:hypothetical protein